MKRLIENTVFSGLVTACRFATCPTRRSPSFVNRLPVFHDRDHRVGGAEVNPDDFSFG
jgi:hypothetical protein